MQTKAVILMCGAGLMTLGMTACKKSTGGGGGGGGWLVGSSGLVANVDADGKTATTENLGASETLNEIACRYSGEAWVVGAHGTLLYTSDGGQDWEAQTLPTTADLYALATQDAGPVFLGGDGVFLTSTPDYVTGTATWRERGDGVTRFRSIAAAQRGTTVLAISDDGGLWSYAGDRLSRRTTIDGARAIAISPDGQTVIVAGAGLERSIDGGATFTPLAVDASLRFADVRVGDDGDAVAVGAAGAVARIDGDGHVRVQRVGTADLETLHIAESATGDGTGYTAGEGGQVWITKDSGSTWSIGPDVGHTVLGVDEIGAGHR